MTIHFFSGSQMLTNHRYPHPLLCHPRQKPLKNAKLTAVSLMATLAAQLMKNWNFFITITNKMAAPIRSGHELAIVERPLWKESRKFNKMAPSVTLPLHHLISITTKRCRGHIRLYINHRNCHLKHPQITRRGIVIEE